MYWVLSSWKTVLVYFIEHIFIGFENVPYKEEKYVLKISSTKKGQKKKNAQYFKIVT